MHSVFAFLKKSFLKKLQSLIKGLLYFEDDTFYILNWNIKLHDEYMQQLKGCYLNKEIIITWIQPW